VERSEVAQDGGDNAAGLCRRVALNRASRHHRFCGPLRLAEHPEKLPHIVEYRYAVVQRDSAVVWWEEDFGEYEPLPRFGGGDAIGAWDEDGTLMPPPAAHKRKLTRRFQTPRRHSLLLRHDRCDAGASASEQIIAQMQATWCVQAAWDPLLAGFSVEVGPTLKPLGTLASHLQESHGAVIGPALAQLLFVRPRRSRLLGGLAQLSRKQKLPPDVWRYIGELVGLAAAM